MSNRLLPPLAIMLALAWPGGLLAGSVEVNSGTGSTYTLHLTTLKEAKFRNTIRQKYDFSCGSAAVATLLTYQYGYPVTEQMAFAQMIGVSRETVTRVLTGFKKKKLLTLKGATLTILDRAALERLANI